MLIFVIAVLMIGVIFLTIAFTQTYSKCPTTQTIYKYVPRTFEEEMDNQAFVSDIFHTMFTQDSPWIRSVKSFDTRKAEEINKYFISQY